MNRVLPFNGAVFRVLKERDAEARGRKSAALDRRRYGDRKQRTRNEPFRALPTLIRGPFYTNGSMPCLHLF